MSSFLDAIAGESTKKKPLHQPAVALTIAGSDSGGGAGIQADLKTFAALKVFGTSVLTLITAQNTKGVTDLAMVSSGLVRSQYAAVLGDLDPKAAKTGALGSPEMIATVAELLREKSPSYLVVDPVMISKHGDALMGEEAQRELARQILPLATLVTPNRFEASALIGGRTVESLKEMKEAAKRIFDLGAQTVLIKGGHFDSIVRDIFYDGQDFLEFGADRVDSKSLHGSGCTFSAAITAELAKTEKLVESIGTAREFITAAIAQAPPLGTGISPVNPMHSFWT